MGGDVVVAIAVADELSRTTAAGTAKLLLPRYAIFKSKYNSNYLRYYDENVQAPKFLQFSGPNTEMNPDVKFEIEVATSNENLVHIRSCYSNKYWQTQGASDKWIAAKADKPDDDQSKWSCTLFQPIPVDAAAKTIRLRHVKTGNYACLWRVGYPFEDCLNAAYPVPDPHECEVFTVIDWESIIILPKRIVFKGVDSDKYLKAYIYDGRPYMAFLTSDITEQYVPNEVIPGPDGTVRIRNDYYNKLWRHSPETNDWILVDSDDTTSTETLFQPVKIGDNIIALRNLGNYMFSKRLTTYSLTNCLSAITPDIDSTARLLVEEPVLTRTIGNINFHFGDSRIYGERPISVVNEEAVNKSTITNTIRLSVTHTDIRIRSWSASASLKLGITTTLKVGIPLIAEGEVSMSAEFSAATEWGQTVESRIVNTFVYSVPVPPMTKVKVSLLATQAYCDVPFSYTQRDVLINGTEVVTQTNDGVYTGLNSFNYHFETEEEPLVI